MDLTNRRYSIGLRIRQLREKSRQSQQQLGEKLAHVLGKTGPVNGGTISRYEEGKRAAKPDVLEALARVFNVKSSWFFEDAAHLDEPRAAYGEEGNTLRLPVFERLTPSFPAWHDEDAASFMTLPRHLFPGAKYVVRVGTSLQPGAGISAGDHAVVAAPKKSRSSIQLVRQGKKFRISSEADEVAVGTIIGVLRKF